MIRGIARVAAEAGHEGLSARYCAIHAIQNSGNQVRRVFRARGGVVEQARIVAVLAALPLGRMARGAIAVVGIIEQRADTCLKVRKRSWLSLELMVHFQPPREEAVRSPRLHR